MPPTDLKTFERFIERYGLTLADLKALDVELLASARALNPKLPEAKALKLNYRDSAGHPLKTAAGVPFYRLRLLPRRADHFAALTGDQGLRYWQPGETRPYAYLAPGQPWAELLADPARPLLITEGELKAAKACKEGFTCVALGGVHSWRSLPRGLALLPELEAVSWAERAVGICFDSDYLTNPHVVSALNQLARELGDRGALVQVITLPALPDLPKTGLDDLLVRRGPDELRAALARAVPHGLVADLFELNARHVKLREPAAIFDLRLGQAQSPEAFRLAYAAEAHTEITLAPDGSLKHRKTDLATPWLAWPLHRHAERLTYLPGQPPLQVTPAGDLNAWPGWGGEPRAGDVSLFTRLVDHLTQGEDPAARAWLLRWLACPLQRPGTKLYTAVVLHGTQTGTGKTLLGYTLRYVYGQNFSQIGQEHLESDFNDWLAQKQLILGDDVTGSESRRYADKLKNLITQAEVWVNQKYLPRYRLADTANYLFTSNQPNAFFLEDLDRRFFVVEVAAAPLPDEFYARYDAWYKPVAAGGADGYRAVFAFLLGLDLGDFNPRARAPQTLAKARMQHAGRSDLAAWVQRLREDPGAVLRQGEVPLTQDLFTNAELLALYDPLGETRVTAGGLGLALRRAGFQQVTAGVPVRLPSGTLERLYIIRDVKRWEKATPEAVRRHLTIGESSKSLKDKRF